jgi:hypothetical protein
LGWEYLMTWRLSAAYSGYGRQRRAAPEVRMPRIRVTSIGVGTPLLSASLSWEYAGSAEGLRGSAGGGCLVLSNGHLPKVRQVRDPVMLGVHPSVPVPGGIRGPAGEPLLERVPAYVARDIDDELRHRVAAGGFVLLVGDSSAGKSRAAYQAIAALPDHVLVVPRDRESLSAAVDRAAAERHCILWLDDLESYLGVGGLNRSGIIRVLTGRRAHRVIVATLRTAEEAVLMGDAGIETGGRQHRKDTREVLELASRVMTNRIFSASERDRARTLAWDPRISGALAQADTYGVAEYLAAGPELMRDWEDAWSPNTDTRLPSHPRGAALIAAAVDIRRGGYISPLPRMLLERVHEHYLNQRGGRRLQPEPLAEAWTWTTSTRRATTALLEPVDDRRVQVFDYLLDTVQRRSPYDHAPAWVLKAAIAAAEPGDAASIAGKAYDNGRYELEAAAWHAAHQARSQQFGPTHPETLAARAGYANALRELDRPAEAQREHLAIVDVATRVYGPEHPRTLTSRNGHAFALIRQHQPAKAEHELRAVQDIATRALGPGHDVTLTSRHLRAIALHHLSRLREAETENWFVLDTWTRDFGPENASTLLSWGNLAVVLYSAGRIEEAGTEAAGVLECRARVQGPEHPLTLSARAFHADVLRELGYPAEAEREHLAIIDIAARVLGPEHPRTLGSRNGQAFALIRQDQPAKAEHELRAVYDIAAGALGPEHDVTLTSRHLRAIALRHLSRLDEAEAENRFVLETWTRELGPESVSTLLSRGNLAEILRKAGHLEEARNHARAVLGIRSRLLGPDHHDTQYAHSRLSSIEDEIKRQR